ncbi:MAG TPA: hypothetical protein VME40_17260 [Caulobacteraceae bacterium]|nr:hypothetical protein [Caulobacteraceae bacterium]
MKSKPRALGRMAFELAAKIAIAAPTALANILAQMATESAVW